MAEVRRTQYAEHVGQCLPIHRTHASGDGPRRKAAVADHLPMTLLVHDVLVRLQPVRHFRFDSLAQSRWAPLRNTSVSTSPEFALGIASAVAILSSIRRTPLPVWGDGFVA